MKSAGIFHAPERQQPIVIPKPPSHSWLLSLALLLVVATPTLVEPPLPVFTTLVKKAAEAESR